MTVKIRFVAECYDLENDNLIDSKILREDEIIRPKTLKEFGYLHQDQIHLLQSIQDFKLTYEMKLINDEITCPKCGRKAAACGLEKSNFHAALTDHVVNIQRRRCKCGWSSSSTVSSLYGTSSHPDLVEKQLIQGSEASYRQASRHLNAESAEVRSINNDDRIRRNISEVAKLIVDKKLQNCLEVSKDKAAKKLIVVIDGGHLKSSNKNSRSFESMIATVFQPHHIRKVDKHHNEITQKTSVGSALSDGQKTIKQLTLNACKKEGCHMNVTELTALTDGANNCWSIANELESHCKKLVTVLDWFHITKKFTIINNQATEDFQKQLEKVKWFLWYGHSKDALERLKQIQDQVSEEKLLSRLEDLYEYLERNQKYIVNYQERQADNLPFSSTIAESSVNALINARQKDNKKMQWTREGAHSILQIRTSCFSKTWKQDWESVQKDLYREAA